MSMLARGRRAKKVSMIFSRLTIYNNRYAQEGISSTTGASQRMSVAVGTTMKLVRRK